MENQLVCCICGERIAGYGNCSQPVKDGRCCDKCNVKVVIPRRIELFNAIRTGEIKE